MISLVQPKDLDGFKVVLDMSAQGKLNSLADWGKDLKDQGPGILGALRL